jgi:hypothetical protein
VTKPSHSIHGVWLSHANPEFHVNGSGMGPEFAETTPFLAMAFSVGVIPSHAE